MFHPCFSSCYSVHFLLPELHTWTRMSRARPSIRMYYDLNLLNHVILVIGQVNSWYPEYYTCTYVHVYA